MERPCTHCDHPDSSLLRIVLIGEMIRADDATLYAIAGALQNLGLIDLADEEEGREAENSMPRTQRTLRLVK